jgi:hypothetical protein
VKMVTWVKITQPKPYRMNDQSTSDMVLQEEPEHRRRPRPMELYEDPYVQLINSMRDEVDATPARADSRPYDPIGHALETVSELECSGSSWTQEHLIRLQVVVFDSRQNKQLFPAEWEVRDNE